VPVLLGGAAFDERRDQGVSFVLDLTSANGRIPGPTGVRELTGSAGEPSLRAEMGYATRDVRREARSRVSGMGGL